MAKGLIYSALLLFGFLVSINGQCTDLDARLRNCATAANQIINSVQCEGLRKPITTIYTCYDGCGNSSYIPLKYSSGLSVLKQSVNKALVSRCTKNQNKNDPAEARDGDAPANACDLGAIFPCITDITSLIQIPNMANQGNLQGICGVVSSIAGFLDNCGLLAVGCADLFISAIDLSDVQFGIKLATELTGGGCDCASTIGTSVERYTAMPTDPSQILCPIVTATTETLRGVLDNCVNKLTKAFGVPSMDWLDITLQALNIANPVVGGLCGTVGILTASATTLNLSLFTVMAAILIHLLRH